jgi:hypothetical protein
MSRLEIGYTSTAAFEMLETAAFIIRVNLEYIDLHIQEMDRLREIQVRLIEKLMNLAAEDSYDYCLLSEIVESLTGVNLCNPDE